MEYSQSTATSSYSRACLLDKPLPLADGRERTTPGALSTHKGYSEYSQGVL